MRLSNLYGIEKEDDEEDDDDSESSSDEEEEGQSESGTKKRKEKAKDPILHGARVEHAGNVNRIRGARLGVSAIAAVWNDFGKVQLWNLTDGLKTIEQMEGGSATKQLKQVPIYTFDHKSEGYGLCWSPLKTGMFASGDHKHLVCSISITVFNVSLSDLHSQHERRWNMEHEFQAILRSY